MSGALEDDALLEAVVLLGALLGVQEWDAELAASGLVSGLAHQQAVWQELPASTTAMTVSDLQVGSNVEQYAPQHKAIMSSLPMGIVGVPD